MLDHPWSLGRMSWGVLRQADTSGWHHTNYLNNVSCLLNLSCDPVSCRASWA